MAIHKTEGIILASADWSESSQTLTLFTPNRGKLSLNVRGSRRLNGKRGRPLRFARLEISYYLREDAESGYLSDVEPLEVFLFEKEGQLGRLTFASAALELLKNLLTPQEPQAVCYQLTLSFLRMTDGVEKNRLPGLFGGYILRLISLLGFRPNLAGCVGCGKELTEEIEGTDEAAQYFFSAKRGGIICENCRQAIAGENRLIGLRPALYDKLNHLMRSSLEEASQLRINIDELTVLVDMIVSLLRYHAGDVKPLKSFDFLDKLARAVETYGG